MSQEVSVRRHSWIDLQTGEVDSPRGGVWLKAGELSLRLLRILFKAGPEGVAMDSAVEALYGSSAGLLSHSGPRRLHTLVGRIRFWARASDLELAIRISKGRLFLVWDESSLKVLPEREGAGESRPGRLLAAEKALRQVFPAQQWMGSSDVARVLNVSPRTANYRLKALSELGRVRAEGSGPARRYLLNGD